MQRNISIDVCNYAGQALCNLYDSKVDVDGQATNVIVHTERNGFKELSFLLPSECYNEKNYRLEYLVSNYRIRLRTVVDNVAEIDWFLISESKVTHKAFSMEYEIKASHVSQLLNTKNLNLEFSDEEGNNTGTIGAIAATILEGTGWHISYVAQFLEEDKFSRGQRIEKVRSFNSSAKTGAFKMMADLCELFDAKPIYHGQGMFQSYDITGTNPSGQSTTYGTGYDYYEASRVITKAKESGWTNLEVVEATVLEGRTVEIIPMNPFSEKLEEGQIPQDLNENKIIEMHYDKNVNDITRTLDSSALVTVLNAYGSYGDRNGMASLQNAEHAVITFPTLSVGNYWFTFENARYYFIVDEQTQNQKWSALDFQSRSYLYNGSKIIKVSKEPKAEVSYSEIVIDNSNIVYEKNQVPYVMDFTYFDKVGLLSDEMFEEIVNVQTEVPAKYVAAQKASLELSDIKNQLANTASSGNGFLKLDISGSDVVDGNVVLTINKTTDHTDGVIFRSDYDESKRNFFTWNVATGIKANGEAIAGQGCVVYIVRQGNPTKWIKSYVKALGNGTDNYYRDELGNIYALHNKLTYADIDHFPSTGTENYIYIAQDTGKMYVWLVENYQEIKASAYTYGLNEFEEPSTITLWTGEENAFQTGDKVYMFSSDSIAGMFGPREDSIYANRKSIEEVLKVSTETHPIYFVTDAETVSPDACLNGYGWYYRSFTNTFAFGDLYFCWGKAGDLDWHKVYVSDSSDNPELISYISGYRYYYSLKRMMLYRQDGNTYRKVDLTVDEKKITNSFAAIIEGCTNQEVLTKGMCQKYTYNGYASQLPIGNYAFKNEFDNYWLFTTDMVVTDPSLLCYIPSDKTVWQDNDEHHILKGVEHSFRYLEFPKDNELYETEFVSGGYSNQTFSPTGSKYISSNIYAHGNTAYQFSLPEGSKVVCLSTYQTVLDEFSASPFTTPNNTTHMRVVCNSVPTSSHYLRVSNYQNVFFCKDVQYTILNCTGSEPRQGIYYLMDRFILLAHDAYEVKLPQLRSLQNDISNMNLSLSNLLEDMYREGFWQENSYVEGDEYKLYVDALDNLKEISHPQATYDVSYLDLYEAEDNLGSSIKIDYPDIDVSYAVHLIDTDIDTNRWAYIDSIDKCYDQPEKTNLTINTRLSMIGQQSFTDVLSKIAEVANQTKAKQSIYGRAEYLGSSGKLASEKLEGMIQANKVYILGGTSNWYTDNKGNIVFEDASGISAMMLTGRGLMVSQEKDEYGDWVWRTALTGKGFNVDEIATGQFSAQHILAGTITVDKLSSSFGQDLDISSNKALTLYATADGSRPAGGLETAHPNPTDSYIKIAAQDGLVPAYIDIQSGGKVNIYGGSSVNIEGGTLSLTSQGKININSGTTLDIKSGGILLIDSANFKIAKNQITNEYDVEVSGKITATSGKIAGYNIGTTVGGVHYLYSGDVDSMSSAAVTGVYLGTDGIHLGNKFKVTNEGNVTATNVDLSGKIAASSGSVGSFTINSALYTNEKTTIDTDRNGVYIGSDGISLGNTINQVSKFKVTNQGVLYAKDAQLYGGTIGGWTISQDSIVGTNVGLAKTTNDTDVAIWAGNSSSASALFKVQQNGKVIGTNVDIKGAIKATDLYVGATNNSNGTLLKLDSNSGLVMSNSSTASTAVRTAAGITVDSSGVVIAAGTENVATAVKSAAGIKVATNGVVINSSITNAATAIRSDAGIKVATNGVVISSSTTNAATAIRSDAGITVSSNGVVITSGTTASTAIRADAGISIDATTGVVISASGNTGSTSATKISKLELNNNKIAVSCTDIGDSSSSGIYITPTLIRAKSTGDVDFSAAKSFSIKAGSITMAAISDYTPVDVSGKQDKVSGITINSSGIAISGSKYIKLDVNANNYVHINSSGIDVQGSSIKINGKDVWNHDNIRILTASQTIAQIETEMAGVSDWLLIQPYYDSRITYVSDNSPVAENTDKALSQEGGTGGSLTFPDVNTYSYQIKGRIRGTSGSSSGVGITIRLVSKNSSGTVLYNDVTWETVHLINTQQNWTFNTGWIQSNHNYCKEGSILYVRIEENATASCEMSEIKVNCACAASSSRAPCTVYYYKGSS